MEKIENEVKTKEETKIYFYLSEEKMKEMEAKIYQSVIFSMNQIMIRELENLKSKIDEEVGRKIEANRPTVQTILQTKEVVVREIDYDVFNKLIDDAIIKYDADKTNLVDFALDSTGGHILEASGDLSFWEHSEWEEAWQHPIAYFLKPSPSVVIQRTTNTLIPGNGWCFKGNAGFVTIGLSYPIKIDSLTYEHIHISNSPSNSISSAPKQIEILGMMTYPTTNKTKSLGNFTFINIGKSIQTFQIKTATEETFPIAQIKIKSNYGANYTCLYRLRVHGKMTGSH
uniref:SUN domain-containing protein n=1 Tax=Rhabditophanes sp. KR3021 TaxID=114890 RepID=A0AC35UAK3_9BILA